MRRALAIGLLLGALDGCGPFVPPQGFAPHFRVDTLASEVSVRHRNGDAIQKDAASKYRAHIGQVLEDMTNASHAAKGGTVPARFKADVVIEPSMWPMALCLAIFIYQGCPVAVLDAEVDLILEVGGRRHRGRGRGSFPVNLYYNTSGFQSVGLATERALEDAVKKTQPARSAQPTLNREARR